jgi:putative GTP pyrophosphokinase
MSRKYSNNKVKKSGEVLSYPINFTSDEHEDAQNVLTYWRTIHATIFNTFQATLRDKLKRLNYSNYLIAQRLKRVDSIVKKLKRFPNMKLSTMQDIAGLRAILKNVKQVRELEKNYRDSNFRHVLKDYKDYITNPDKSGYRGIHLIYEYINDKNPDASGLKIELQIRTKLQHTWATAVETMGIFLNQSLKSSQGPTNWLEYFALVSAGFAILENSPIPVEYQLLSDKEIFRKIVEESYKLEISSKLRGFTVASDHIVKSQINSKYNLIILNLDKRILNIKYYTAKQLEEANVDYTNIEREINRGANLQAVLVSTDSIESLKKAYPSYFLDTHEYLDKLNLIKSRLSKM